MVEKAWNYIIKEWDTVIKAPVLFFLILAVAVFIAFKIISWRYSGIVDNLEHRLSLKEDQLDDYRERLHLVPVDHTTYSKLTNDELKQRTSVLVGKVRGFLYRTGQEDRGISSEQFAKMSEAKTEEERNKIWHRFTKKSGESSFKRNSEYDKKFKVDTILLRDEIQSRLPKEFKDNRIHNDYEHPINPIGMEMIIGDLERLAKSLP